ncbi:MAG: MarR family transcriptional regulator [Acidobacteria bacterium]|nr:MAG: MarR family transcriptional regulator [Acidobacteriota bacterium]PYY20016.1 MAG: MarR family transcriptional regulator [Acidobacteriota bacterium]
MSTTKEKREWELADRLHSAAIHLLRRLRIQDLNSGIGPAKLSALSVLVFSGRPLSLAELAAAEQVKNPTMSRLIAAMERERLVRITPAKEDARSILIAPTHRGRALLLAGKKRRVESLAKALSPCDVADLDQLGRSVELLNQLIRRI